ncbi:MAG: hypothetical protein AB1449_07265 [Chloroflexota bacterium]
MNTLRSWLTQLQRRARNRTAHHLEAWFHAISQAHAQCVASLGIRRAPEDLGQLLDRVDLPLARCHNHEAAARRAVRRRYPELARQIGELTSQACTLRNLFFTYLVRWGALRDLSRPAINARRQMEEARLRVSVAARALAAGLEAVAEPIRALVNAWRSPPGPDGAQSQGRESRH